MAEQSDSGSRRPSGTFDFSFVYTPARIAVYDDLLSAPRVFEVEEGPTAEHIEKLASLTYEKAHDLGGTIPYTVIREVCENFIHARFSEVTVSVLDGGNTVRFADQGPGIQDKQKASLPGFTSATEDMKSYIRGVGSGLPLVREYLQMNKGLIEIDDNIDGGTVVTLSVMPRSKPSVLDEPGEAPDVKLSPRQKKVLEIVSQDDATRVTDVVEKTGMSNSSAYNDLEKLRSCGLISYNDSDKTRRITPAGENYLKFHAAE